jgi:hypothetical protein
MVLISVIEKYFFEFIINDKLNDIMFVNFILFDKQ